MFSDFTTWLLGLITDLFGSAWDFISDLFVSFVTGILAGFASLVAMVPVPAFMQGGLGSLFAALPSGVSWVVAECGIVPALAVIGAGYTFRLVRKLVTLGQW